MRRRVVVATSVAVALGVAAVIGLQVLDGENPTVVAAPRPTPAPAGATGDPASAGDAVRAGGPGVFPRVTSRDLNGTDVELPTDLPGATTVVLVSWDRDEQGPVDAWIAALAPLEAERTGVDHVQLAVTPGTDAATRSAVTFFMGRAIPDEAGRARTIPLFTDPVQFAELIGVDAPGDVTVLLVTDGAITWRHTGAHSEQAHSELVAELDG